MNDLFKRLLYPGFDLNVRARASIRRLFLNEPGSRTLDVGCGNGYFSMLAARAGSTVLGVSFDAEQIERCRAFFRDRADVAGRLEFKVMTAAQIRELGVTFDQILLLEVLEHIDHDVAALDGIVSLLKPNGLIHITVPDVTAGRLFGGIDRRAEGGHCRMGYDAERIAAMMRGAGLDIAYQTRVGSLGNYLLWPQEKIRAALGNSIAAQAIAFSVVYPLYLLLKWVPIPYRWRPCHHVIGRKQGVAAAAAMPEAAVATTGV